MPRAVPRAGGGSLRTSLIRSEFAIGWRPDLMRLSARRTAHEDSGAVTAVDLRVDVFQQHHAAVERNDLTILLARRLPGRPDIVLALLRTLETKLLQLVGVGKVHHDPTGRALADHVRLLALAARVGLGARPVLRLVIGGISPAADDFARPDLGRDFRLRQRRLCG